MSYIGQQLPADVFSGFTIDKFTGDGTANKALTLSEAPFNETAVLVTIDGVVQEPTDDFTVSGTTLTLVGTAANNSEINVTHLSGPVPVTQAASLDLNGASDKLILDADADTTISADTDDQIDIKLGGTDVMSLTTTGATITNSGNEAQLTLTSTDADANVAPLLKMNRNSASPAVNDQLGKIQFIGQNDAGEEVIYGQIVNQIKDETDGTEDGRMAINIIRNGADTSIIDMQEDETVFNNESKAIAFRVESADAQKAFRINGNYAHAHLTGSASGSDTKVSYYSSGMGSIQLGKGGGIESYDYGVVDGPYVRHNMYQDGGNGKKYIGAGEAASFGMYDGIHLFYTASSGSGDASVTQNERFRIANDGTLTATDTTIGSNSDQRLKQDIVDHTYDINKFKAFKPRSFAWIHPEAHTNEATTGFVAQEIESIDADWAYEIPWDSHSPDDKGPKEDEEKALCNNEPKKASKLGKKDAMYISVIQQLITRIEALEDA